MTTAQGDESIAAAAEVAAAEGKTKAQKPKPPAQKGLGF